MVACFWEHGFIKVCWRERMGVEPTRDTTCPTTDLKSAKPTGTHSLPCGITESYSEKTICSALGKVLQKLVFLYLTNFQLRNASFEQLH